MLEEGLGADAIAERLEGGRGPLGHSEEHTESARTVVPHAVPTIAPSRAIGLRLRPQYARGCSVRSAASPRPRQFSTN